MRLVFAFSATLLAAAPAFAADFPVLRGSQQPDYGPRVEAPDWTGFYLGGHAGYSSGQFGKVTTINDLVANILRNTAVETQFSPSTWPNASGGTAKSGAFGVFGGYNWQFGDAVFGVEGDFTKLSMKTTALDSIGRVVQPTTGYVETVNIDSSSSSQIDAYGTLRARIGWNAGWFMPFATGGLAVGKGSSAAAVTVTHSGVDADPTAAPTLPSFTSVTTANASRKNSYTFGWAAGAGVDVLIASNILLRAEYQYVKFGTAGGIPLDINTVRGAVGVKF